MFKIQDSNHRNLKSLNLKLSEGEDTFQNLESQLVEWQSRLVDIEHKIEETTSN